MTNAFKSDIHSLYKNSIEETDKISALNNRFNNNSAAASNDQDVALDHKYSF